jgi:5'-methylthioadenosine phosphorylase
MLAIIGGTGFEKFDDFKPIEELDRSTPFGAASTGLKRVKIGDHDALFIPRHGSNHELLPTEVNYRANIYALKKHGGKRILCTSAIGSLQKELAPGDLVIPNQYIDRTKGIRSNTFSGNGVVAHVSLAHPTCPELTENVRSFAKELNFKAHFDKIYVCIEGPQFSTQAESQSYRGWGAEVIGMTGYPELSLAREAGLCYLPCCFVTDYDCWDDSIEHVTLDGVMEILRANNTKAFSLTKKLLEVASATPQSCPCHESGFRSGLMTPDEALSPENKQWVDVLRS